jgi:hypothetical protein
LAAGKLIIVNFGGWIRTEIEGTGCGVYVDQEIPGSFVQRLQPFINDKSRLQEAQHKARQLGQQRYSRRQIGERFASLFES